MITDDPHKDWSQLNQKYFENTKRTAGDDYVRFDKFTLDEICCAFKPKHERGKELATLQSAYGKKKMWDDAVE